MKTPYFTIICPNYKTEPFLEQCLLSVKNQTFQDFECLLLNDGSPGVEVFEKEKITNTSSDYWFRNDFENQAIPQNIDLDSQSEFIFNKLVGNDSHFRLLEHANMGQGPTRNRGIAESKGQRVVFLDCDDFLDPNYLKKAFEEISNSSKTGEEVFYTGIQNYENGKIISFIEHQKHVAKNNNLATIFTFPTWTLGPVNYFWRLDILKKYNVQYPGGRGEDTKIFLNAIVAYQKKFGVQIAKKFTKIGENGYFYRLFPFQNYRVPHFEEELFDELTKFVSKNLQNYDKFGIQIAFLARLYILRFKLYRKKLQQTNKIKQRLYDLLAKIFTLFSFIISGYKKEFLK